MIVGDSCWLFMTVVIIYTSLKVMKVERCTLDLAIGFSVPSLISVYNTNIYLCRFHSLKYLIITDFSMKGNYISEEDLDMEALLLITRG